jgi:SAM-dependent methyltransferase
VCGNDQSFLFRLPTAAIFSGYPLDGAINLHLCPNCHFCWNSSTSDAADYREYYEKFNKHHVREGLLRELDIAYFTSVFDRVSAVDGLNNKNLLDYGSGDKSFSDIAFKYGVSAADSYDIGAEKPKSCAYDLVVCLHAMEHFYDFNSAMKDFSSSLKRGGLLYIAVPDMEGYLENYYGAFNAIDFEHINHFSATSLGIMVQNHGFSIKKIGRSVRRVSENVSYPEVWIICQFDISDARNYIVKASEEVRLLTDYLSLSIKEYSRIQSWYEDVRARTQSSTDRELVLVGLGTPALRLVWQYRQNLPDLLCDNDPRLIGRNIFGKEVVSLEHILQSGPKRSFQFIILAVNNHRLKQFLLSQGVEQSCITLYEWSIAP